MQRILLPISLLLLIFAPLVSMAGADYPPEFDDPAPDLDVQPQEPDRRPMLGVQMSPPSSRVQQQQGLGGNEGVYVHRVYNNTAASQLGVQRGDVITAINGRSISSMTDLREVVMGGEVGDAVDVVVRRDGDDVSLTGGAYQPWPDSIPYQALDPEAEARYRAMQNRRAGRQLKRLEQLMAENEALMQQFEDLASGEDLGLEPGMVRPMDELPRLANGELPSLIPLPLLRLKAWSFDYGMAVDAEAEMTRAVPADAWSDLTIDPRQRGGITVAFEVSSELY